MPMLLWNNFADREFRKIMHILDWLELKILLHCRVILQSQALKTTQSEVQIFSISPICLCQGCTLPSVTGGPVPQNVTSLHISLGKILSFSWFIILFGDPQISCLKDVRSWVTGLPPIVQTVGWKCLMLGTKLHRKTMSRNYFNGGLVPPLDIPRIYQRQSDISSSRRSRLASRNQFWR